MLHLIRSCSPVHHVSSLMQRASGALNNSHTTINLTWCHVSLSPRRTRAHTTRRYFTTTGPSEYPTQSPSRKLDIFLPQEAITTTTSNPFPIAASIQQGPNQTPKIPKLITAHHDLQTYLSSHDLRLRSAPDALSKHKLNTSSVHLGTRYEYLIQSYLESQLGFSLTRIGGRGDGGVDLIGNWTLPVPSAGDGGSKSRSTENSPTFRILLQAKRLAAHRKPMPALMRELDGTIFSAASSRWISSAFIMHDLRTRDSADGHRMSDGPLAAATSLYSESPSLMPSSESQGETTSTASPELDGKVDSIAAQSADLTHESSTARVQRETDLSHLPTLGILVTTRPLTAGIEKAMASSRRCLMYICLEEVGFGEAEEGESSEDETPAIDAEDVDLRSTLALETPLTKVRQIAWNPAASKAGLEGYDVVTQYSNDAGGDTDSEAVLMFQGMPLTMQ